jgi:DNA-binding NarL/FixJ family response regulator
LVAEHTVARKGIRMILSAQPDLEVVAEAKNGLEAVETLPDVVDMEGLNGIEGARRIAEESPRSRVLALSMHGGEAYLSPSVADAVLTDYRKHVSSRLMEKLNLHSTGDLVRFAIRNGFIS